MNTNQKDNLLLVSESLKSWASAIELISTVGAIMASIGLICMYAITSSTMGASGFVFFMGFLSIIASATTGLLIAKCLEAGSLALQSLNIIQNTTTNKSEK